MSTYAELLAADLKRQTAYLHLDDYDLLGYKGAGITVLNAESSSDHREMTSKAFTTFASEATLLESNVSYKVSNGVISYCNVTLNGETITLEEAIDTYGIKIITKSWTGTCPDAIETYFKELQASKGVIFLCAAGNESDETGMWVRENTSIAVSASKLYSDGSIEIIYYGSEDEVDFTMFMSSGTGTSASTPALAALIARLLCRYGDFNQEECVEILQSICFDLGDEEYFGYGLPVLPLTDTLQALEDLRVTEDVVVEEVINVIAETESEEIVTVVTEIENEEVIDLTFPDVEDTRWSKEYIDECVDAGLLAGYDDGTFQPEGYVTREQMAVILTRILDKL
jgi:hypothetical protein